MSTRALLAASLTFAVLLAAPLRAQGGIELGGFGSYTRFDSSLALGERPGAGARLSLISGHGWSMWMLEAEGSFTTKDLGGVKLRYIPARARLMYALPLAGPASLILGGGAVRNDYNAGSGTEPIVEWGYTGAAGFRLKLGSYMTFRVEGVMDWIENPYNESDTQLRNINYAAHAGLSFPLWQDKYIPERKMPVLPPEKREAPPVQIVREERDEPRRTDGPDADRDGVADANDICANTPSDASVDRHGCQVYRDSDGDGVIDQRDRCPATPSDITIDGTGCPMTRAMARVDTVYVRRTDTLTVRRVDTLTLRRTDTLTMRRTDTLFFKGPERTLTLRGVTFAAWSDELTPNSMAVLDLVAKQLIEAPTLRVEVAGHTDASGQRMKNVRLSLARAEAVRAYLVMQGVPAERLSARGYGPDKPMATNATLAGRRLNRRVELRRVD